MSDYFKSLHSYGPVDVVEVSVGIKEMRNEIERLRARVAELESQIQSQKANRFRASQNDTPEGDADTNNRADDGA